MTQRSALVIIYSHPEFYPPTLNLISGLAKSNYKVSILCRNLLNSSWDYPQNTTFSLSGKKRTIRESERVSTIRKIFSFLLFTFNLAKIILFKKPSILIICDPIPTFSYRILKFIVSKKIKIWYHNHDIIELDNVRKYSLSWFSFHSEKSIFKDLDIFTLPSESRRSYFPIHLLKGKYYFLPNYPSTEFYSKFSQTAMGKDVFRIIFQGEISEGHGFEEIIEVLNERINNKEIELVLVGRISDAYRQKLTYLSRKCKVEKKLIFTEFVSYKNLPNITRTCQLGIAIYTKNDIMNNTISTASNKIYEYAALGLPVILFDHQQFRNQLELFPWCFFTNLSKESLISILYKVVLNFEELSISAKKSQEINLNYESFFNKLEL